MEMHSETPDTGRLNRFVITPFLVIASLYSLYLVIHPYTPFAKASLSILDLTQVQRATHVFFLLVAGYLLSSRRSGGKAGVGAYIFALMAAFPLYAFWQIDLALKFKIIASLFWLTAVLPAVYPSSGKWMDKLGALLVIIPYVYQVTQFKEIIDRAMVPEPWDLVMAFGLTLLLLGQVYRYTGAILPCLVFTFLLYNLYGNLFTGIFAHASFDFDLLLAKLFSETEAGLFGMITGVSVKYLVYFTILGGIIGALNLGRIIGNIASLAACGRPDGPGIVTVIASVFMGMFSGSGAADTQFVSTISKPMFEKGGYGKYEAAGIAATSGTIAMITPPVLGSMAFVMVEILSIPYSWVCIMALGPMLLYIVAIVSYNYLYVKMKGIKPVEDGVRYGKTYFLRYSFIFLPILLIVGFIYFGYSVSLAVVCSIALFVILSYLDPTLRPASPMVLIKGLANGFSSLIPIGTAVVCANLILTLMVMTGLPNKFSQFLTMVSGQSLMTATFLAAGFALLLGMGIPPTATYVVASSLTAPAILQVAMANGIPQEAALLSTHMFLMYYAVLADVTPPVALSAYAASSVFHTDPLKTGIYAAKVALPKYLLGFSFILGYQGTALLIIPMWRTTSMFDTITGFLVRLAMVSIGAILMAAATVGYTRRPLHRWECWVLGILSLGLFVPFLWINLAVIAASLWFFLGRKKEGAVVEDLGGADACAVSKPEAGS
ncbi:TRAP transporter permease [Geobacter argillaceus]|uniref:TRAP transporter 4TM/12TM fusion protein n=1 Tax=Geobacter argillaceus TaxID=345631 RepID=A0A562VKF0_9BACT|nr:TRAP transporter fused permease subunit [Geobacter argillaceus]TWJ18358.1 TRAP transporter 4TM/12TM fusion protein [Geobacter argillaceus]